MNRPDMPARLAKARPLVVANARRANQHDCALGLDWTRFGDPLGHADPTRTAAILLRAEADAAGGRALVAGDIGPTGEIMAPLGTLSRILSLASYIIARMSVRTTSGWSEQR